MALELDSPNIGYIMDVLKERGMTPRQLSKQVYGKETHRDIVKEITQKPDVRASTVLKLCRALGITMDSLYQNSDTNSVNLPSINGIGIVNNSPNAHVDMADLRAENKALKMVIEEKISDLQSKVATSRSLETGSTWYYNSDRSRTRTNS